ncbi:T9SS type A sorting domain-containing protein [Aggregatimonas sangjinii]|uniref:T9SS type A sorting domain-containing protein n=1 Tax=Aggregatimonas sangjinii TaxID=2583587 RepID=A0A5B7SXI8_9FLAO|nr:Ig-like domain-containing protein [Aggregatimonas sangjinii]QCX01798.1 T9SS type A sorting domain-containing protein [Aggregatimonas sangjinii]
MLPYSVFLKRNEKKYILFILVLALFLFNPFVTQTVRGQSVTLDELKAFPTAEGFGKSTIGGRGKAVAYVTNLNDSGAGSLRAAMEDPNVGYVLLKVWGTIILQSDIRITTHKTLAGQTASIDGGQGITLRNNGTWSGPMIRRSTYPTQSEGQIIIRFINSRRGVGTNGETGGDNITLVQLNNLVLDHCDVSFSTDENLDFSYSNRVTIQDCNISEALAWASHQYTWEATNGYRDLHSKGGIFGTAKDITFFRNLMLSNDDRNMLIQVDNQGSNVEFSNNLIYNARQSVCTFPRFGNTGFLRANVVGNLNIKGPQGNNNRYMIRAEDSPYNTELYLRDNIDPNFRPTGTENEWVTGLLRAGSSNGNGTILLNSGNRTSTEHNFPLTNSQRVLPVGELKASLIADVGNSLVRDSHGSRQIGYLHDETGGSLINADGMTDQGLPQFTPFTGGYSTASGTVATVDSDSDGLPDNFEAAHGVTDASGTKVNWLLDGISVTNNAGYSNLEIYLAYIARDFHRMAQVDGSPTVAVTGLDIDSDVITLNMQETAVLTATITPANATNQNVRWSSSNTAIATVDQNGNVSTVSPGTAVITATAVADASIYDTTTIVIDGGEPTELWLEAECATIGSNWTMANDTTASGNRYLLPPTGNNLTEAPSDSASRITFYFTANAGSYAIFARLLAPSQSDDSFWIRVNGGTWVMWNQMPSSTTFEWSQVHDGNDVNARLRFTLEDGANTMEIAHREDGVGIDKVFIANTGATPVGSGQTGDSCSFDVLVDGITINPQSLDLEINQVRQLTATVSPSNATDLGLIWSSSDTNTVTVDQNGNVTAVSAGNAIITATAEDGSSISGTVPITVSEAAAQDILVNEITINPQEVNLELNQVQALTANLFPANATDQSIRWSSSNTNIATVDQNGNVTAVAIGNATITATANDAGAASNTIAVNVSPIPDILVQSISINPQQIDLDITQVHTFGVNVAPANATNQSVTWASSNTGVATVDQYGNVTALTEGNAMITATAADGSGASNSAQVNVSEALPEDILVEGIALNSPELTLEIGQVEILAATVSPTNATDRSISWTSSSTAVVTVDQNGNVTAVGTGSATITVRANDFSGIFETLQIRVVDAGSIPDTTELWLEAECANVGSNWNIMDNAAASGGKYLIPSTGNNYDEVPTDTNSIITYDFTINAGTYSIYARAMTPSGSDDSFWVRVNGGAWLLWNQIPGHNDFEWNRIHDGNNVNLPVSFTLLQGNNTLEIAHREDGAGLDKILITNSTNAPIGLGQTDNTCTSATTEDEEETFDSELISPVSTNFVEENFVSEKTTVYPNPTRGQTMVSFPRDANYAFYSLYGMNGTLIKQGKIEDYQTELPISLAEMENGMYLLRLYTALGEEVYKKVIKG